MTGWQVSRCPLQSECNTSFILQPTRCGIMQSEVWLNFRMAAAEGRHYSTNLGRGSCCVIVFLCAKDSSGMSCSYLGVFKKAYLDQLNKLFIRCNSNPKHVRHFCFCTLDCLKWFLAASAQLISNSRSTSVHFQLFAVQYSMESFWIRARWMHLGFGFFFFVNRTAGESFQVHLREVALV